MRVSVGLGSRPESPRRSPEPPLRSPLPSGLCLSALPPPLSYVASVAKASDREAGRPPHQPAGLPRRCGLPSAESRFPHFTPRPTAQGRVPGAPRAAAAGSASAGKAGRASCAFKAINAIRGIFNCSIKHAVNNYSRLC